MIFGMKNLFKTMKAPKYHLSSLLIAGAFATCALSSPRLMAQNGSWTGAGNQTFPGCIWGGPANWQGNRIANGAGNTATFGTVFTNGYAARLNTNRTLGHVVYNDPEDEFDFILRRQPGNTIVLTLDNNEEQPTLRVDQAGRLFVMDVPMAGESGFAKEGPGHLVLSNSASTYTGPINVNEGMLEIGGGVFTFFRGPVATRGPEQEDIDVGTIGRVGDGNYEGEITIAENASFFYNSDADSMLLGDISGEGTLSKGRGSLLTLSGVNTYTGGTSALGGTLLAISPQSLPGFDEPGEVVFDGGTIGVRMGGDDWSEADVDTLLANATRTAGALGIDTTNGDLDQWTAFGTTYLGPTLGLTKLGENTLTLGLANDYSGATTVRQGMLRLEADGTLGDGENDLILEGGALDLGGLAVTAAGVFVTGAATEGPTISMAAR